MKFFKTSTFQILITLLLLSLAACTEDFNDLNTDPSVITEDVVEPGLLLTTVQRNAIYNQPASLFSVYSYYHVSNAGVVGPLVDVDRTNLEAWEPYYKERVININEAVRVSSEDPIDANRNAIARIWRVWIFHQITDIWGNIPYSEAGLGVDNFVAQPAFDSQQSIYEDMLNELTEAADQLDPSLPTYGNEDLIYNGDVALWERFANSLRLRLAMRVRYADEALAGNHIGAVINAPLISENSQNASLTTAGEDAANVSDRNPLYNNFIDSGAPRWCSFTITDLLQDKNDPRLSIYCKPAADGVSGYRGRPLNIGQGQGAEYNDDNTARLGDVYQAAEVTYNVITAAEVSFLKAEAYLAGLASGSAQEAYQQGIQLAMENFEVDVADINAYVSGPEGTLAGTTEGQLEQIIVQKYLATYYQPREAWAEYRRTGYPVMYTASTEGDTNGEIPRRLPYPEIEYILNNSNAQSGASGIEGGDLLTGRVWWDAKPGLPYEHPLQGTYPPN